MPLRRTGDLVGAAMAGGRAIAAFNVITLEHAEAIAVAAERTGLPAILQISHNAVRFHGGSMHAIAAGAAAVAAGSRAELALHLDHVEDLRLLGAAAGAGFSSAMFDPGSRSYDDNVAETREAVRRAHSDGLWLEAELGYIGGKPGSPAGAHQPGVRTDPGEAAAFVAATGVDALAVAVGSSHAMTTATAVLDHELIARLRSALAVPLVLHGSSGVAVAELRAAVAAGIVKVNVGTALNVAFTQALRVALRDVTIVDPRTYLDPARTAITGIAHELLAVLGAQR